jgi:hypothetical protein
MDPTLTRDVCMSLDFDMVDRYEMRLALQEWNRASHGRFHLTLDQGRCNWKIVAGEADDEIGSNEQIMAYCDEVGGSTTYVFRARIEGHIKFRHVMMHEIGHLLGAVDSHSGHGLMDEFYSDESYDHVDKKALQEVLHFQQMD